MKWPCVAGGAISISLQWITQIVITRQIDLWSQAVSYQQGQGDWVQILKECLLHVFWTGEVFKSSKNVYCMCSELVNLLCQTWRAGMLFVDSVDSMLSKQFWSLSSRWRSQVLIFKNDCLSHIFWTLEPFSTKLGMLVYDYRQSDMWRVWVAGHGKGSNPWKHVCASGIFWIAELFVTKFGMWGHHYKLECYATFGIAFFSLQNCQLGSQGTYCLWVWYLWGSEPLVVTLLYPGALLPYWHCNCMDTLRGISCCARWQNTLLSSFCVKIIRPEVDICKCCIFWCIHCWPADIVQWQQVWLGNSIRSLAVRLRSSCMCPPNQDPPTRTSCCSRTWPTAPPGTACACT